MQPASIPETDEIQKAKKIIAKVAAEIFGLDISEIHPELGPDNLKNWDSLNHLRLVTAVETKFSIRLTMRQVRSITCLNDFVHLAAGEDLA